MRRTFKSPGKQRGVIILATLLALPTLLLLGGVAVTLTHGMTTHTQLGNAAESAAMFLSQRNAGDANRDRRDAYNLISQFSGVGHLDEAQLTISQENNGYRVAARASTPYWLLAPRQGESQMTLSHEGAAGVASSEQIDIVMVIDLSSSQAADIARLQQTLKELTDNLERRFTSGNIRIGLIPFSFYPSIQDADWLPESRDGIECTDSTSYTDGLFGQLRGDAQQTVDDLFTPPDQLRQITHRPRPKDTTFLDERCPDIGSLALTEEMSRVKARIDAHQEPSNSGITTYHHSVIFGARMLSPSWANQWDANSPYRKDAKKVLMVIGDGKDAGVYMYNFTSLINLGLCDDIRDEGIAMYGVKYGDFRDGSNIEDCIGSDKMSELDNIDKLIDSMLDESAINADQQKLKLIP